MKNSKTTRPILALLLALLFASSAHALWKPLNPVVDVQKQESGLLIKCQTGTLRITVCTDSIIHVQYSATAAIPEQKQLLVIKKDWPTANFQVKDEADTVTLTTARMSLVVDRKSGAIAYHDAGRKMLVKEGPRSMTPAKVNGEDTFHAETFIELWGSTEGLYGLGSHQSGVWNLRGESVDLSQDNSTIAIPLLLSSNGYGIFWNNTSRSRVNNRFQQALYINSEVADVLDYYYIYGPDFDSIVAGYRQLTGAAPLFGNWAYGFWQCKNRYMTQQEILDAAHKYRALHIPVDSIVQDWFWWNRKGEHVFNSNYPQPQALVDELHRNNFHIMISIWPFFEPGSKEYEFMDSKGWFIDKTKYPKPPYHAGDMAVYDATNPEALAYYWGLVEKSLFKLGFDAWWMDTTEPETESQENSILLGHKLGIGSGDRYANVYALLDTLGMYEGQRAASDKKRVFILSRSAFAGSQRNSIAVWSGDVTSNWETFRRQIPAGLNYALSGMPYWTTDIGGFTGGDPKDPAYRELVIRWFQFGTFNPLLRVHGSRDTELWNYGDEGQKILVSFDRLRYRLLPYTYSLAWKVTSDNYTIMRPLVMDFRTDERAQNIGDQFMFGPALLVSPVTEQGAVTRHLYLPNAKWVDFWTGRAAPMSGIAVDVPAPLSRLPLYVRGGSILPLGPDVEYASQKPTDPLELRIYRGADGDFTLYEDEGDTYNYEKGAYATIPLHWDDAKAVLTIGERKGSFPGMLQQRTFNIVLVRDGHGAEIAPTESPDKTVTYTGAALTAEVK